MIQTRQIDYRTDICIENATGEIQRKNKELHMVFVDLEKAYDRVPRELIWWSLRKKRVPEAYNKSIQDIYEDCETQVTTREGNTE